MLESVKTYILEPWQTNWTVPFAMSVLAASAVIWAVFYFSYGRMLDLKDEAIKSKDEVIKSKDAEIKLLDRYKSLAQGASPEQLKSKMDTLEQKASLGPPVKTSAIEIYVGSDPWSSTFVPVVHTLTEFWALNGAARIHGIYVRLDTPERVAVEFRFWTTRDFLTSKDPLPARTQMLHVPPDGKKTWSYFYIADEGSAKFKFVPGDYKLALFAYDDDGKEFIVKSDIRFILTTEQVAHITAKQGVYLNWNGTEKRYTPQMSSHAGPR